jgi:hypothetical protein
MNDNENKTNAPIKLPDLLPCPFCGGDAAIEKRQNSDWPVRVVCDGCKNCTAWFIDYAENVAVEHWNKRAALNEADALRSMLAAADSIRIPTDNDGHFTTINKFLGQGTVTKQWYGKWQIGANYEEVFYDTALEAYAAYAAIKPNAAAGEEGMDGE